MVFFCVCVMIRMGSSYTMLWWNERALQRLVAQISNILRFICLLYHHVFIFFYYIIVLSIFSLLSHCILKKSMQL